MPRSPAQKTTLEQTSHRFSFTDQPDSEATQQNVLPPGSTATPPTPPGLASSSKPATCRAIIFSLASARTDRTPNLEQNVPQNPAHRRSMDTSVVRPLCFWLATNTGPTGLLQKRNLTRRQNVPPFQLNSRSVDTSDILPVPIIPICNFTDRTDSEPGAKRAHKPGSRTIHGH